MDMTGVGFAELSCCGIKRRKEVLRPVFWHDSITFGCLLLTQVPNHNQDQNQIDKNSISQTVNRFYSLMESGGNSGAKINPNPLTKGPEDVSKLQILVPLFQQEMNSAQPGKGK